MALKQLLVLAAPSVVSVANLNERFRLWPLEPEIPQRRADKECHARI